MIKLSHVGNSYYPLGGRGGAWLSLALQRANAKVRHEALGNEVLHLEPLTQEASMKSGRRSAAFTCCCVCVCVCVCVCALLPGGTPDNALSKRLNKG